MFREATVHTRKCVWTFYLTILVLKASKYVTLPCMNLRGNWLTNYSKYTIIYFISLTCVRSQTHNFNAFFAQAVTPCLGMCGAKGYMVFSLFGLKYWVSILTILVINRVWFVHSSLELGMLFRRSYFFIIWR